MTTKPHLIILAAAGLLLHAPAFAQQTERVSIASDGTEADFISSAPAISGDGRFVAFTSIATNLVPSDTNGVEDIFVRDRETGQTTRVSVASDGSEGDDRTSLPPAISADGRFVAFGSNATNLVPNDTNGIGDVFVHDLETGATERVSIASDGTQGNGGGSSPAISADGRFVAFGSSSTGLVPNDTNGEFDVFMHDRQTGETTRVSVASDGTQGDNFSGFTPAISGDGRFVAFASFSSNLVTGDTNGEFDVFVHDRQTGETERVSIASDGTEANEISIGVSISADGRFVAFQSAASNLVPDDTNGAVDIFVHDRQAGATERVSVASDGSQGNGNSGTSSIASNTLSADGRFVTFDSHATNLVPNDTNGTLDEFVHDRETGETTRVNVASNGTQANGFSRFATISADGNVVAFASFATNLVADDTNGQADVFVRVRETVNRPASSDRSQRLWTPSRSSRP